MDELKGAKKEYIRDLENQYIAEIERLQRDMRTQVNILQYDRQKLIEANNNLKSELINVKQQFETVKTLADIRGKELIGAQKFLSKADTISITDLTAKVLALNGEISGAVASLSKGLVHQVHEVKEEEMKRLYDDVVQMIGEPLTRMLVEEGRQLEPDKEILTSKIELWDPNDPKISDFFTAVYMNIQNAEEPAVSGRWRALTQAHTRPSTDGWKEDLISKMMKVFKLASWRTSDKNHCLSFEGKLAPIFKAVEDLRIALGEKITSSDIHVSLVPPNSRFDALWMDNGFAEAKAKPVQGESVQRVVGTTGLGLKRAIFGRRGPSGEVMFESILSPQVVLESTLKDTLNPPPTRRTKPTHKAEISTPNPGMVHPGPSTHRVNTDVNHSLVAKVNCKELNSEIYQMAVRLSKEVVYERTQELPVEDLDQVYAHVEKMMGRPLFLTLAKEAWRSSLDDSIKAPNPFLVCAVLRAHIIYICMTIIDKGPLI
ncbi:hypothetical protein CVT24_008558 [Panaeolus cyanescens]|uniref:Uncharacterized protein n=1 Tax=Panaeolus cyanescens TaxID=181874 RepID=A0A409VB61_9AGAR|nr:hypothetical protein CVT24_008558 [Panaeolus cyanescens]